MKIIFITYKCQQNWLRVKTCKKIQNCKKLKYLKKKYKKKNTTNNFIIKQKCKKKYITLEYVPSQTKTNNKIKII